MNISIPEEERPNNLSVFRAPQYNIPISLFSIVYHEPEEYTIIEIINMHDFPINVDCLSQERLEENTDSYNLAGSISLTYYNLHVYVCYFETYSYDASPFIFIINLQDSSNKHIEDSPKLGTIR